MFLILISYTFNKSFTTILVPIRIKNQVFIWVGKFLGLIIIYPWGLNQRKVGHCLQSHNTSP